MLALTEVDLLHILYSMADQTQPDKQESNALPARTLWHRLLGKELELALTPVGVTVLTEVQVSSNPPKADILLLRRQTGAWTAEQLPFLPDGVRASRASHILIEFKYRETIQSETFQQAIGYDYFYQQGQQLARNQVETFIFSAKTPQKATLQTFGYEQAGIPGVYRSKAQLLRPIPLIILNELPQATHNAFVQCFASQRRIREAAFARLLGGELNDLQEVLKDFMMGLRTHIQTKEGNVSKIKRSDEGLTPEMVIETGRQIRKAVLANLTKEERLNLLNSLPREEILARLAPEERLAGLAPEERLAGLAPEERLAGLAPEERLAGLAPEEIAALMKQIEIYLQTQHKA